MTLDLTLQRADLLCAQNFINGEWTAAASGARLAVLNPADQSLIGQVPDSAAVDAQAAADAAAAALVGWRATPARQRAQVIKRWHALILAHQDDLGRLISREQG